MIDSKESAVESIAKLFLDSLIETVSPRHSQQVIVRTAIPEEPDETRRWFKQSFSGLANLEFYVGVSHDLQTSSGAVHLDTWGQLSSVFDVFERKLRTALGISVSATDLVEAEGPSGARLLAFQNPQLPGSAGLILLGLPEPMLASFSANARSGGSDPGIAYRRTLDALMNLELPVTISFGSVHMPLGDVVRLTAGSTVEFDHRLDDPVEVIVDNRVLARGEVVVVDGNYGVRVTEVVAGSRVT